MLDVRFHAVLGPGNSDHIEPGRLIEQTVLLEELESKFAELSLFDCSDSLAGMPCHVVDSSLHFDEHDLPAVEGNQIQLTAAAAQTTAQNAKSLRDKILFSRALTPIPQPSA
jgi:hypothetical protein